MMKYDLSHLGATRVDLSDLGATQAQTENTQAPQMTIKDSWQGNPIFQKLAQMASSPIASKLANNPYTDQIINQGKGIEIFNSLK